MSIDSWAYLLTVLDCAALSQIYYHNATLPPPYS